MDISTVRQRTRLKPRRDPYWEKMDSGEYLGFRKTASVESWHVRWYDRQTRSNRHHALGEFGSVNPSDRYGLAKAAARKWLREIGEEDVFLPVTVHEVCERYAKTRPDAEQRFKQFVYHDPIANLQVRKLTRSQVLAWRKRLTEKPALVTRRKSGNTTKTRSLTTINRDMVPFRAALNLAFEREEVPTNSAWRVALKPARATSIRRNLYLDKAQRKALLKHLDPNIRLFARGLCALPFRPGALAALRVNAFDVRRSELMVEHDKTGRGRALLLPDATAELFTAAAGTKPPDAWLFTRKDGRPWQKDYWKKPIKTAAHCANLPEATTIYTLRHSTITDLVVGGLDLFTVAQVADTSIKMIEQHYGHLQKKRARDALASLVL